MAAVATSVAAAVAVASPASAAEATWEGYGANLFVNTRVDGATYSDVQAGIMRLRIEGVVYAGYCIDFFNDRLSTSETYVDTEWASVAASTAMPSVNWVLRNSYPLVSLATLGGIVGTPLTADQAAAATQAAIWSYTTPGFALTPDNPAPVLALYAYLSGPANVGIPDEPPGAALSVTPGTATGTAGSRIGPFTVATTATSITVTAASPGVVVDATGAPLTSVGPGGTFYVQVPAGTAPGSLTVTLSGQARLGTGRVFFSPGVTPPLQDQVLAEAALTAVSTEATVSWTATPPSSTTSSTTSTTVLASTTVATTTPTTAATTTSVPFTATTVTVPPTTVTPTSAPATTTTALQQATSTLPRTGGGDEARPLAAVALALLAGGVALVGLQWSATGPRRRGTRR